MKQELTDELLEKHNWYVLEDTLFVPVTGMYENPRAIQLRIITMEKPT